MGIWELGDRRGQNPYCRPRCPCSERPPRPQVEKGDKRETGISSTPRLPPLQLPTGARKRAGREGGLLFPSQSQGITQPDKPRESSDQSRTVIRPGQNQQRKMPERGWAHTPPHASNAAPPSAGPWLLRVQAAGLTRLRRLISSTGRLRPEPTGRALPAVRCVTYQPHQWEKGEAACG